MCKGMFWTKLSHAVSTLVIFAVTDCNVCMCLYVPGVVHRPEPNTQQKGKEEAIRGRHTDRHQSDWVRPARSACQDQQQVNIWSSTDFSVCNKYTHTENRAPVKLPTSEINQCTAYSYFLLRSACKMLHKGSSRNDVWLFWRFHGNSKHLLQRVGKEVVPKSPESVGT